MANFLQQIAFLLIFAGSFQAQAKLFRNSYVSFELPSRWSCKLEGTEWVCTSQFAKKAKEAIIILTAKEAGPSDHLNVYYNHLRLPKTLVTKGKQSRSKFIHVKKRRIANHEWVDGMHLGSEIKSYYSRYLATKKNQIAILVTFSAHKRHYTKYSRDFLSAIQSLKVVAGRNILNRQDALKPSIESTGGHIGVPIADLSVGEDEDEFANEDSSAIGDKAEKLIGLLFIIGAIGLYLYSKKGSRKKTKRKKRGHK